MSSAERSNPIPVLLTLFSALLALCAVLSGGPQEILGVLPAILLALALSCGRYPGEGLIDRFARRLRRGRTRSLPPIPPFRSAVAVLQALLLLAATRQLRAPPLPAARIPSFAP